MEREELKKENQRNIRMVARKRNGEERQKVDKDGWRDKKYKTSKKDQEKNKRKNKNGGARGKKER